jgi:hypothetical protein
LRKNCPAKEGNHGAKALTDVQGTWANFKEPLVISQDDIEVELAWFGWSEKRQKKTPRKEGGDTRGPKALRLAGNRRVQRNISKQQIVGKINFEKNVRKKCNNRNFSQ